MYNIRDCEHQLCQKLKTQKCVLLCELKSQCFVCVRINRFKTVMKVCCMCLFKGCDSNFGVKCQSFNSLQIQQFTTLH